MTARPVVQPLAPLSGVHVVFVEPEIHWNTGNVGRTCLALGARLHLVEPLGFSLDAREVKRAGLDYWPRVDPVVWPSLAELERALPELGEPWLISPDGTTSYWDVPWPERAVLLFGKESTGLPLELRARHPDRLVHLPMLPGSVRSLNLSTSAALVLYELARRRR